MRLISTTLRLANSPTCAFGFSVVAINLSSLSR